MVGVTTSYLGINGRAAGPIQIGPSGVWIKTTVNPTAAGRGTVSLLNSLNSDSLAKLRVDHPTPSDEYGVVTVGYLKAAESGATIDLSKYALVSDFDKLYNAVLGAGQNYPTGTGVKTIVERLVAVEGEVKGFSTNITSIMRDVNQISAQSSSNTNAIASLNQTLENLKFDPFGEPVLLVAGGALDV